MELTFKRRVVLVDQGNGRRVPLNERARVAKQFGEYVLVPISHCKLVAPVIVWRCTLAAPAIWLDIALWLSSADRSALVDAILSPTPPLLCRDVHVDTPLLDMQDFLLESQTDLPRQSCRGERSNGAVWSTRGSHANTLTSLPSSTATVV